LLTEAGAEVDLISRGNIHWLGDGNKNAPGDKQPHWREALAAPSAVGPFPLSWLAESPALVRYFPPQARAWFTARCLRAGAAGWLKPRFDNVCCHFGRTILGARVDRNRIAIEFDNGVHSYDHAVLGTGYRIDLTRLGIFAPRLLDSIVRTDGSPILGPGMESSIRKLHFVGSYAVRSFGPLLRFVAGVPYAARAVMDAVTGPRVHRGGQRDSKALAERSNGQAP
jgi:FAD-dependent urate hydroxylase